MNGAAGYQDKRAWCPVDHLVADLNVDPSLQNIERLFLSTMNVLCGPSPVVVASTNA